MASEQVISLPVETLVVKPAEETTPPIQNNSNAKEKTTPPIQNNSSAKEKMINKPTPFTGNRKRIETFLQECQIYLQINRRIYETDEDKIAFILSYMNEQEALRWKQTYLRSIVNEEGNMEFPTIGEFVQLLGFYFKPANQVKDAIHQLNLLRQGKKTAEETVTEFRLLTSQAGYTAETPTDHLHLIEKLQKVLNTSLVKKIMLSDNPPTTIDDWAEKAITIDSTYRMTMEILGQRVNEGKAPTGNKPGSSGRFNFSQYTGARRSREDKDPNAMDVDAMTTEKRAALMRKGACFKCEKPGHLARDHDEFVRKENTKKEYTRGSTSTSSKPKKKNINEIHALLQSLSPQETKELLALQTTEQEEKEESKNDEEDF